MLKGSFAAWNKCFHKFFFFFSYCTRFIFFQRPNTKVNRGGVSFTVSWWQKCLSVIVDTCQFYTIALLGQKCWGVFSSHSQAEQRRAGTTVTSSPVHSHHPLCSSTGWVIEGLWRPPRGGGENWVTKLVKLQRLQRVLNRISSMEASCFLCVRNMRKEKKSDKQTKKQHADTAGLEPKHTYGTFLHLF